MSRDMRGMQERFPDARVVAADLLDPASLAPALHDIDVAHYLAHSMAAGERGLAKRDKQAAIAFGQAAAARRLSLTC